MQPKPTQTFQLVDAQRHDFGQLTLDSNEDGLLTGTFAPGPDYPAAEPLFRAFEEAANSQALSAVDRLGAKIAALGLRLLSQDGTSVAVDDVQIWSDGGISCRLKVPANLALNGSHSDGQTAGTALRSVQSRKATEEGER
jgi:hypothetical protein